MRFRTLPRADWNGVLCLTGSVLAFGSVPLFLRHFSSHLDAWTVNGVRYATAALIWLPVILVLQRRDPSLRRVWRAALPPAVVNFLGQVLWAFTPYYNEAPLIGFGIRMSFLFTLVFGLAILPDERALARVPVFWAGVATSLAGLALMYWVSLGRQQSSSVFGIALIAVTSVFWGLYAVLVKRCVGGYPARMSFGVISLYTATGVVALLFVRGDWGALGSLGVCNWGLLVASGVVGIAVSHVMLFRAIVRLGAIVTGGATLVTPLVTWLGGLLILGEHMSGGQLSGGLLLVCGAALLVSAQAGLSMAERRSGPACGEG